MGEILASEARPRPWGTSWVRSPTPPTSRLSTCQSPCQRSMSAAWTYRVARANWTLRQRPRQPLYLDNPKANRENKLYAPDGAVGTGPGTSRASTRRGGSGFGVAPRTW